MFRIIEETVYQGPNILDKCLVGFIWTVSFLYGCLTDQILSKEVDLPCSVRSTLKLIKVHETNFTFSDSLQSTFGAASVFIAIIIPTILGPILAAVGLMFMCFVFFTANFQMSRDLKLEERRNLCCNILLTVIFLATYSTSMILTELYLPIPDNIFYFVLLKFILGVSHQLLGPIAILTAQTDIRHHVGQVYRKGGTSQNTTMEITYEELQRNLGLGVDIG